MKRKWFIVLVVVVIALVGLLICSTPGNNTGPIAVNFLTVTNDATGARVALFSAENGTDRLYIRGRSEVEIQGNLSNQVAVTQITNVDYLNPGQLVSFSVPCPTEEVPWRLDFYYVGQFNRMESLKYELGWALHRRGLKIPVHHLPRHEVRELETEWISE